MGKAELDVFHQLGKRPKVNRLGLMMPFPFKQLEYLLVNINSWGRYFQPCESELFTPYIDLVLYISRDDGMLERAREKIDAEFFNHPARKCFTNIRYAVAGLKKERDRYGPAAPDQFYRMWDGQFPGLNDGKVEPYDYIFYMEPDTRPIRKFWLDKAFAEIHDSSPFWSKGSIGRYGTGEIPHLNGNSL